MARNLGYHEFFGFGVDAGIACFVDTDARDRLSEVWRDLDGPVEPRDDVIGAGKIVARSSGWGDCTYPTWTGRDTRDTVACFVADMLFVVPSRVASPKENDDD
jgi:hypothetical protein